MTLTFRFVARVAVLVALAAGTPVQAQNEELFADERHTTIVGL